MSAWDTYSARINARGTTRQNASLIEEKRYISTKLINNLSYHHVVIDGVERDAAVINSDNLDEKTIIAMPGEHIRHGAIVEYANNHWLVAEKETDETVYSKGKMLQCNHILKWIDEDNIIHRQWCVVEDGTKSNTWLPCMVTCMKNLIELLEHP